MSTPLYRQELSILGWAESEIGPDESRLRIPHGPQPLTMEGAVGATGRPLIGNGDIGADVIRLAAGAGFAPHTHPGHHVLTVIAGIGTITYGGRVHETRAGQVYLIEGSVPHAVGAITDHLILAVGAPHKPVDSTERMELVPYIEVLEPDRDMDCLICGASAGLPDRLHDAGCAHCPCAACVGMA
ncbi:quercetin dioxygenase-like cupin family protein [Actinocorallia herbida]|uniref:Quercetin dioxygenase-like cupin family protein n=1 Tax=Actinocorallia herbida TaxID=58109 RepID=A0A3N1DBD8_9ACTN|nr:cupin domain-containing protein [Actinocorallia herbida]ROO90832.1 quercetin dioxygenase-like cupin family protein [Actinocorallia herbida]